MQVQNRVGGGVLRFGVLCDGLVRQHALDLELASLQGEDLGLGAGKGVDVLKGELGAVFFGGAGEEFESDLGVEGDLEAPFPEGLEADCAGLVRGRRLLVVGGCVLADGSQALSRWCGFKRRRCLYSAYWRHEVAQTGDGHGWII